MLAAGFLLVLLMGLVAGSLLSLSSHPHWFVRGWDFPRVQIVCIAWLLACGYWALQWIATDANLPLWPAPAMAIFLTLFHGYMIYPYTYLGCTQAASTAVDKIEGEQAAESTVRFVITNLQQDNDAYDRWMEVMQVADPDILIGLEPDQQWVNAIDSLVRRFPYRIVVPQDNCYGIMLLSRLPIESHQVRHLVQSDVPSIDARVRLPDGRTMRVIAVHPRPPEPLRDNDATARDAELTLWGRELADDQGPAVIGGDLNDVAWSQTTRLFLRTSQLLDPRRGRGFFNTFHASRWYLRFPLDHVFHSTHFTVSDMRRLDRVGSDHFPMLIDLRINPRQQSEHEVMAHAEADEQQAEIRVDRAEREGEPVERASLNHRVGANTS
jgi:endonuclease/exonuclease/phosphatase (EEP) superfamily protein YafD